MIQVFYSIFNDNDELLFANNTQFNTKEEAIEGIDKVYKQVLTQPNIQIVEHTNEMLKFIDKPVTELEGEEIHTFQIL